MVDPDDHHLFATLGCAVENIVVAARHYGYDDTRVDASSPRNGIIIHLASTAKEHHHESKQNKDEHSVADALYEAVFKRQCTRADYDGNPLDDGELKVLQDACKGYRGVSMHLYTDTSDRKKILNHIIQANTDQLQNKDFMKGMKGLKTWIRFGESEAVTTGDGLFGKCNGNPVIP